MTNFERLNEIRDILAEILKDRPDEKERLVRMYRDLCELMVAIDD